MRRGAIALLALLLGACTGGKHTQTITSYGAAAEPRAAMIGRSMIDMGGNAVDAAAAMALTMAVTLPSRVGLTAGGVCLVHDPASHTVRGIDFLAPPAGSGTAPVPALLRGLYTLHAAYGRLRWEQVLGSAESLAGTGTTVSRALAADLAAAAPRLAADAEARRLFLDARGRPLTEGATLVQPELAALLSDIRRQGIGVFYGGPGVAAPGVARTVAALGVDRAELTGYRAEWRAPVALDLGRDILHLATRRSDGDGGLGAAWQSEGELPAGAGPAPAGAALAVVDPFEQGVACTLSLGGLFGSGRMAPETGLFLARSTGGAGLGGPVMVVNPHLNTTLFAGGGALGLDGAAGPGAGAAALLSVLRTSVIGRKLADEAVSAPRSGAGEAARVEAVACLYNRSEGTKACNAASDPRGSGLAFGITQSNK